MNYQHQCTKCGRDITARIVWLTFDQRINDYTDEDVPEEFSQGGFAFGEDCAGRILTERKHAQT